MTKCMLFSSSFSIAVLIVWSPIMIACSMLGHAYAAPVALPDVTPGPFHPYSLMMENQTYQIRYAFSDENEVKLESITADHDTDSITVRIDDENPAHVADTSLADWEKRIFFIELPRAVINSNSTKYVGPPCTGTDGSPVIASSYDTDYNISVNFLASNGTTNLFRGHYSGAGICDSVSRTSEISYPAGKSTIVIQGTTMVPEFGSSLTAAIMAAMTISTVGISVLMGRKSTW